MPSKTSGFVNQTNTDCVVKAFPTKSTSTYTVRATVRTACCLLYVSAVITVTGCGDGRPNRVPVSGTVLIDGQPLKRGFVKFVPANGRPSLGEIREDGKFTLTCFDGGDGAILGTHRVQVSANRIISNTKIEWHAPPKYADFRTSELQIEVIEPVDDLTIELKSGGRKLPFIEGS
jgi:hypothetical protein